MKRTSVTAIISPLLVLASLLTACSAGCLQAQENESTTIARARIPGLMRTGDYATAIELLRPLTKASPDNASYHFSLADAYFMNAQSKEAVASYDRAIKLQPNIAPQSWQRGLALYYAGEFEKGKAQFETHQTVNRQDVENSVWHLLCHAKVADLETARKEMIPISGDQRIPMPEVFELFAGKGSIDLVMKAAEEAGSDTARYYAHLYIGLFHEMSGDSEKSLASMREASKVNPISKAQLMGSVADVHLMLRDPDNRNQRP